jgi:O-antigen/teichoic acid export membrane protein
LKISSFTTTTFITFVTRVVTSIISIGISIIIARVLGPEGKGIYSLAILLPGLLVIFTNLGVNPTTVFLIAKKKYPPKMVFGNNIIITLVLSAFTVLLGIIIIFFWGNEILPGVKVEYLLLGLCIIPFTLFFDFISHILVGLQKIIKYNIVVFLQSLLFIILIGTLLLRFNFGTGSAILSQIIALILSGVILFTFVLKETGGVKLSREKNYYIAAFRYGFRAHIGGIMTFLHYRIDQLLINFFINPMAVGLYATATGLAEGILLISRSIGTTLFPKIAAETVEENRRTFTPRVCRNLVFVSLLIIITLIILSHWLILLLYSEAFIDSIQPFRILLLGTLAASGNAVLIYDLMARGKPILVSYINAVCLLVNIVLNLIFIPKWGIIGASWASVISYWLMFIITAIVYVNISKNKIIDLVIIKKSDFQYYKNIFNSIKQSYFKSNKE